MNLQECFDFLNFWIDKYTGSYYSIPELELIVDRGSIALYNDYQPKASTSQRIKDALSPFRDTYELTPNETVNGLIAIPAARNYLNLLDISIRYAISGRGITKYIPLENLNEDERAERLNSQIEPVTVTSPIIEQVGNGQWQLYPKSQYFGAVTFYKRPAKPVFGYSTISGRVIVYNPTTSTQLDWKENQHNEVLLKALESIGINLKEADVAQWAQAKNMQNFQNINHL